tara:strand:+ start:1200 stop:1805 length:606 start_codon:yes stop_codon:yes gene_type:complete
MSRTLSTEMQAVATAELVRPVYLVDMEFSSGSIFIWSGMGDLSYNSNTYLGAGDLLSIGAIQETAELTANGATVTLGGIKQSLLTLARDEPYQGRPLILRLGAFDENGDLITSPVILFSGFMDIMTIADSGDTSTITITVENKLIAFQRTAVRRYTAEDQKIEHPTDKGFEFVAKIQEKEIIWGRPSPASMSARQDLRVGR